MREYVKRYITKIKPLQDCKIRLLNIGSRKNKKRQRYSLNTLIIKLITEEIKTFNII